LRERKCSELYLGGNHQTGAIKSSHLEGFPNRAPLGRVKSDSPHIEEARAMGNEVDRLAIRRPAGFVVPGFAIGDVNRTAA
jgi:hypothetical protein